MVNIDQPPCSKGGDSKTPSSLADETSQVSRLAAVHLRGHGAARAERAEAGAGMVSPGRLAGRFAGKRGEGLVAR